MNNRNEILFNQKLYHVIACENEFIIHPSTFGVIPITIDSIQANYTITYDINDYKLCLEKMEILQDDLNSDPENTQAFSAMHCTFVNQPLNYTGTILIGGEIVADYTLGHEDIIPVFCYNNVFELVFKNGVLTTTIDHRKAMLRIRKNLELGLRSLTVKKDLRCILRFMRSSFVGNYSRFHSNKKRKNYLKLLKKKYNNKIVSIS